MSNRRWLVVALVFLGILVSYIDRGNLSIAAESMMRDLRLDPKLMGVLLSSFFWTYGLCQLPAGLLVDRVGTGGVYAGAFCLWSLASASIAFSRGPGDVMASRLVLGMAESVGPLASLAFIRTNFSTRESGLPVSIYIAGQTIGPACGALLGTTLLAGFGWRTMFAATGLGALLWVPAWLLFAPKGRAQPARRTNISWPWRAIFASRSFWALSACAVFLSYFFYFILTWMPAYMTMSRGFSTLGMGRILSAPLFTMALTNVITGWLADRLIKKSQSEFWVRIWFAAGGLLGAASIMLLDLLPGRAPVLPILLVSICSFGVASSNFWTIAQNTAPGEKAGRVVGYLNTLSQIGGIAAPLITGWSLGPRRDFGFAIVIAGICPLLSSGLLLLAGSGIEQLRNTLAGTPTQS